MGTWTDDPHLALRWLVRLRWGALGLALAGISVALMGLDFRLPWWPLLALCGVLAASNAGLEAFIHRSPAVPDAGLAVVAILDTALITAFLALSGGPMNPFSVLYVVYVALGAVLLPPRARWMLVLWSSGGYASLFLVSSGTSVAGAHVGHGLASAPAAAPGIELHLVGMWVAYTLAAVLVTVFVARVSDALRAREHELRTARERAARDQRLAALTTLAAGAAHELGSPLSTIAVSAAELEDALLLQGGQEELVADARLVRREVRRCRGILDQMAADAGELIGEQPVPIPLSTLIQEVRAQTAAGARLRTEVDGPAETFGLSVPKRAFVRVIANLVDNALAASPKGQPVTLRITRTGDRWQLTVRDRGEGMTPEVLARAGEPFFTTRAPGEGLGLGLFLARAVIEQLGGCLSLSSRPGGGTTASIEVPG
ncbi:MAG TPA: HAMP domain-containing sensor histidine kinase [Polyangiaceae bacterium LLY-WYZ-14_1]|nr:HAMP domain-containing sensor histidine kinase [Polyangiaceae bacterium LLY-WYZ-14_1]